MSDQSEASEPHHAAPESVSAVAPKKSSEADTWLELVKTLLYALVIALGIRTILFQPFNIPSGSMEATLLVGDYLFVEKFSYGYSRYSIPFGGVLPSFGRILGSGPKPGDVVVFKMPNKESTDYGKDFIKRVIGLPGDRIQMMGGVLYINDKPVPKEYVGQYTGGSSCQRQGPIPQYRETLPNGVSYLTLDCDEHGLYDDTGVYTVPAGHYFMMGDNRDNSDDSRAEVGFVPAENLVGKAALRFFSIDETAVWYKPWTWPLAVRYRRMFTLID